MEEVENTINDFSKLLNIDSGTTTNNSSTTAPWVIVTIAVVAIISLMIVILYSIHKNKKIKADGKFNDNTFGISIDDNNENDNSSENNNNIINAQHLDAHPIFTTFFNYIHCDLDDGLYVQPTKINKLICDGIIDNVIKANQLADLFIKNYITLFERPIHGIIQANNNDLLEKDNTFQKTFKSVDNIITDIRSKRFLQNTISNIRFDNSLSFKKNFNYSLEDFTSEILNVFSENIEIKISEFHRDLIILKSTVSSINDNKSVEYVHDILNKLFNAFLHYLFTLYFNVRLEIISDIINLYCDNKGVDDDTK